jgi:hypothetical protein
VGGVKLEMEVEMSNDGGDKEDSNNSDKDNEDWVGLIE